MHHQLLLLLFLLPALLMQAQAQSIIAVDPGSTYVKTVLVQPGKMFDIALSPDSKRKIFSGIAMVDGIRSYGSESFNIYSKKPQHTMWRLRDIVGRSPHDKRLQDLLERHHQASNKLMEAEDGTGAIRIDFAANTKDARIVAPEELLAMILRHCKDNAERHGETRVDALTLTVPIEFTAAQRQGLVDSVEISGMKLLGLVDENSAAAIQYAIDRTFNDTIHMLVFNMGGTGTQVTVFQISGGKKAGKDFRTIKVLSKAWDPALGSEELDLVLAQKFLREFDAKQTKPENKIGQTMRALVRLKKEGRTIKEILSGLDKYPASFSSLHNDIDFSTMVTRAEMEQGAADFFSKIAAPVQRAIRAAGVTKLDLVQVVGGGYRVPAVRAALSAALPDPTMELSTNINSDEGMAFGAAFVAANFSTSFRVPRLVYFIDALPREVRLVLEGPELDTRDVTLMPRFAPLDAKETKQVIKFKHTRDFTAKLFEMASPEDDGTTQPERMLIREYKVTGLANALEKLGKFGEPRVVLTFTVDRQMLFSLPTAEARFEEEYVDEVKNSTTNETESIKRVRKHSYALQVEESLDNIPVKRMTEAAKRRAQDWLNELDDADLKRTQREEARNALEAYGFVSREKLDSNKDLSIVVSQEEMDALMQELRGIEDWIDERFRTGTREEFNQERLRISAKVDRVFNLLKQHQERPQALAAYVDVLKAIEQRRANWTQERPWISNEIWQSVDAQVVNAYETLSKLKAQQALLKPNEDPVLSLAVIHGEMEKAQKLVESILRLRKPAAAAPLKKPKIVSAPTTAAEEEKEGGGEAPTTAGEEAEVKEGEEEEVKEEEGGEAPTTTEEVKEEL